jgi:Ca2+-binding EF-hand superfamily protein
MKHSIISILVAGLFAATAVWAAEEDVKANPKPAESSQSRAGEPNKTDETNLNKDQQTAHDRGAANFKKADKDHDGTLDRKEAKAMPRVAKNFKAIDTDHDGTVSLVEVHTYMRDHPRSTKK